MKILRSRIFLLFVCILVVPNLSIAQKLNVIGSVADSATGKPISNATVSLLRDNKALTTSFSDQEGMFSLKDIPAGTYQLYISLMGYQAYYTRLVVTKSDVNLGKIILKNKSIELQAIEIRHSIPPVTVKKDTLEFNAGSYKTRPNAVVADLLRQVPGIVIDQGGKITAQGETVKRILVDGKPFYGNNPALTTQNLPAEIIAKIQVIDAKSEQSVFSGFDDGNREKVINITLKKDRRHGTTATTTAGAGTDGRFALAANANSFNDNERLSAIVNGNNLNDPNYDPSLSFGAASPGSGIARNWSGALNYNFDNKKNFRLDASYAATTSKTQNSTSSFRQTFLPDTSWYYKQQNNTNNTATEHTLNAQVNYNISPTASILISPVITYNTTDNIQNNKYESLNSARDTTISGMNLNTSHQSTPNVNIHGLFRKRFKKPGQTLSADFSTVSSRDNSDNTYFTQDRYLVTDSIAGYDRLTSNKTTNRNSSIRLSYTTPITKDRFLEVHSTWNTQTNKVNNNTYDIDTLSGKYETLNDSLSNISKNTFQAQTAGISLRTTKPGYDYTLGLNAQYNTMNNENTHAPSFRQHYFTLFPTATANIALAKDKNLRFHYEGGSVPPTAQQLQPLPNLSNSLLINEGNPDLKPSFSHKMGMGYNAMNPTTFKGIFVLINGEITRNKIVNINRYDTSGRQISRPVNANGAFNISAAVTNNFPLKAIQASLNFTTGTLYNRDITYTNLDNNNLKSYTHNFNISEMVFLTYRYKSLLDVNTQLQLTYSGTRYGSLSNNNTNYLTYNLIVIYNFNLPAGFMIGNDIRYIMNRGRAAGFNNNSALLNGYVAKSLFKQKQAQVKLYSYDLLRQNVSIARNVGDNYIEDVRQTVLKPYWMLSFTWFFKNYPAGRNQEG
jgi:hypothetical protein